MSDQRERFGEILRQYREAAGYSQEALAERAGLSANAISALERGERKRPYPDTIRRLAEALGLGDSQRGRLVATTAREPEPADAASVHVPRAVTPLPSEPTPLIGREREADVVRHLLVHAGSRLLTLTGPGGVGKTRLALHVARALDDHFPDGVAWVELAPLGEPDLVLPTIARTFGLEEALSTDPSGALNAYLEGRRVLLVLDNFEHLLDAASKVAAMLRACPDLGVLVTSRAPLNIRGEQEYVVPPLELPTTGQRGPSPDIAAVPSVRLFTWQAKQKDPGFELTPENALDVVAICRRLDGVPLALELAAARVKVLGTSELLARLDRVLPVLTGGPRDLPARQRTMEGAIRWSYDLLRPPDQALFRRLSVFAGGWTLEAAEAVASSPTSPDPDILEGMAALVDQSLVRQIEGGGATRRFTMLETLREFGMTRLEASGEKATVQAAHLDWCVALAETAETGLTGREQAAWLARLEAEHDNLRAALGSDATETNETRLRLAGALWRFWWWHGHLTEGRAWLAQVLASGHNRGSAWRGKALTAAGILAREQGDYDHANAVLEESLAIRRELGDQRGTAQSLNILGLVAMNQGRLEDAIALYEDALALYRDADFQLGVANVLNNLGNATRDSGDFARAAAMYEESVNIYMELGEKHGVALTSHNLGRLKRDVGELDAAMQLFERSLAAERELGDRLNMALTLHNMGRVESDLGHISRAAELYTESLAIRVEFGDRLGCIKVAEDVTRLAVDKDAGRAARLHGAATAQREALGAPLPPADRERYEHMVLRVRERLGDDAFDECVRSGRALDVEQMVDEALAILHETVHSEADA